MEALALFLWSVGLIAAVNHSAVQQYYSGAAQYGYPVVAAQPVPRVSCADAAPAPRRDSSAAIAFGEHWQNFMEPSVARATARPRGSGFGDNN